MLSKNRILKEAYKSGRCLLRASFHFPYNPLSQEDARATAKGLHVISREHKTAN